MSLTLTLERGGGEVSGSGTNIELDGTIAGGAIESVELKGDTEQTTYSGKNLYEGSPSFNAFSGISAWEDGGTYNGMPVIKRAAAWSGAYRLINIEAGATYTFSAWVKSDVARPVAIYAIGSGATATITPNNKNITTSTSWERVSFTVTCSTSGTVALRFENTSASTTNYTYISGYQLEKNSSMTSYEPYVGGTASPNPDYPQEVQTVTGRQVVTISDGGSQSQEYEINLGKNLLNPATLTADNRLNGDGTLLSGATGFSTSDYIPVEPNTTYTITRDAASSGFFGGLCQYDSSKTLVGTREYWDNTASYWPYHITTSSTTRYIRVSDQTTLFGTSFQIEKGSATTYAPYFTPIELCKIGTYQDYIYKSGENWYVKKNIGKVVFDGSEAWGVASTNPNMYYLANAVSPAVVEYPSGYSNYFTVVTRYPNQHLGELAIRGANKTDLMIRYDSMADVTALTTWFGTHNTSLYYPLATPTDTKITNSALIAQLNALNAGTTYDGTTIITVSSENLAGPLDVTVSSNITKTYTEVEIGSPFTIADVEGKSSNTTLDGNVYVDWAYNKKQYSFDLFNLTPQDYADIRAFYDYQFNNSAFPTITVPELNIDKLPVYMEISSRNIINQCLLTDKLTIKFRETVQP